MNSSGGPIPGITVKVTRERSEMTFFDYSSGVQFGGMDLPGEGRETVTDENGFFRFDSLPPGRVALWIKDDVLDSYSENHEVDLGVSIALRDKSEVWNSVIRGRVIDDETGKPVREFTVRVYGKEKTFRSGEGRFTFPRLIGYRYSRVFVTADGNRCAVGREISAEHEDAAPEHEFRLKKRCMEGYVVDGLTGERLAGVPVFHGFAEIDRLSWNDVDDWDSRTGPLDDQRTVISDDDGSFCFCEPEDEKGILAIRHEPYARMFLTPEERVYDPASGLLRVELRPEATLSGVYLRGGDPMPDGEIRLARGSLMYEIATTGEDGRFTFRCLDPGEYRMAVYTRVGNVGFPILTAETEMRPGEHKEFNLTGPDGPYTLTGKTLSGGRPVPWSPVFLTPREKGRERGYACSDAEGRYRIPGLHAGLYDGAAGRHAVPGNRTDFTIEISGDMEMDLPPAEE
jgi:protocatechuate 3,4-dioxygenase beta subunit